MTSELRAFSSVMPTSWPVCYHVIITYDTAADLSQPLKLLQQVANYIICGV